MSFPFFINVLLLIAGGGGGGQTSVTTLSSQSSEKPHSVPIQHDSVTLGHLDTIIFNI